MVAKPSGLVVHRGWARDPVVMMTLLRDALGVHVYPVHRLDRGTSGVLLFALKSEIAAALQSQFQTGQVAKRYLAFVRGVAPDLQLIDHPVRRRERGDERVPAQTNVQRLALFEGRYSVVLAEPQTGRLHQVRRHLKHISCPIIGDVKYGKGLHNRLFRERVGLHRLALHALELRIRHPVTEEALCVRAPLPADLSEPLERVI